MPSAIAILFLVVAAIIAGLIYQLVSIVRARRQRDRQSAGVVKHVRVMGYNATPYGIDVALVLLQEGYNDVEAAMYIVHVALARDVRAAGNDIDKLTGYVPHGMALLEVLKEYKDGGAIRPALWEKKASAIMGAITVDEHQRTWLARVLSDPVADKYRLAKSRVRPPGMPSG